MKVTKTAIQTLQLISTPSPPPPPSPHSFLLLPPLHKQVVPVADDNLPPQMSSLVDALPPLLLSQCGGAGQAVESKFLLMA